MKRFRQTVWNNYSLGAQARAEHCTCITILPTQINFMTEDALLAPFYR